MATTGKINGTIIGLYKVVTGTPDTYTKIANGRSANFDLSVDMIETTEKRAAPFNSRESWNMSPAYQARACHLMTW